MITSVPVTEPAIGGANIFSGSSGKANKAFESAESIELFAKSFAGALAQILQSSNNGSQIEIGVAPGPNLNAQLGQFTITVRNVTPAAGTPVVAPTDPLTTATSAAATSTTAVSRTAVSTATPQAQSTASGISPGTGSVPPASPVPMGYPPGSELFVAKFGSGPTSASEPAPRVIPTADFYQPPPVKSVGGVKTLESYMQEELVLAEYGTKEMIKGTPGWSLQQLTDAFRDQASRNIVAATRDTDPNIAPANWAQIADQYSEMYKQWLTETDAGYWDRNLTGPIYDANLGIVQTSNGPVDVKGDPIRKGTVS